MDVRATQACVSSAAEDAVKTAEDAVKTAEPRPSRCPQSRPSGFNRFVDAQDAEAGHGSGKAGFGNAQLNGSGSPHSGMHYGVAASGFSASAANGAANGYTSGNSLSHR